MYDSMIQQITIKGWSVRYSVSIALERRPPALIAGGVQGKEGRQGYYGVGLYFGDIDFRQVSLCPRLLPSIPTYIGGKKLSRT